MLLHQDGSTHEWVPGAVWDLIVTMDDATNERHLMFFCDEEGTMSSFWGIAETVRAKGLFCSIHTDRGSHYWHTPEAGSAFVPMGGPKALDDILCEVHGRDNCVRFDRLTPQIEPDGERPHYVKAEVRVRRHMDGSLSVWHGPRLLQRYGEGGHRSPKPLPEGDGKGRNPDRGTGQFIC